MRVFASFVLALCFGGAALAQPGAARDDRMLQQAARNGRELQTQITVNQHVKAQAVLIPRVDARRIFGKEIADNYAVIEVNVGNKSPDAALIIHGIFIDYSHWALNGTPSQSPNMAASLLRQPRDVFEATTLPNQIASEEYRVVRGQLLDAQLRTPRNWTMRLLTFAGNLAGAYAFSIKEQGILKGLNAFSGVFVPGVREVWPDSTIDQLNRVSDFGFQSNKVIPREGSEVIVCFFPIDRFLTPGFKRLFQRSPALFFSPHQMLVDRRLTGEAEQLIKDIDPALSVAQLRQALPCYLRVVQEMRFGSSDGDTSMAGLMSQSADKLCRTSFGLTDKTDAGGKRVGLEISNPTLFKTFVALDFLSQMSLNTVSVKIDGVMTVETTTVAGKVEEVTFDEVANCGDDQSPCFWADPSAADGHRTGIVRGSYLTGGSVVITNAERLGIKELKVESEGASDQALPFSFKLTEPIDPGTLLQFVVTKSHVGPGGSSARSINSLPRDYRVGFQPAAPTVSGVKRDGRKLTVSGTNFHNTETYPLLVKLRSPGGEEVEVEPAAGATSKQFEVAVPDDAEPAGCWTVRVSLGKALPAGREPSFAVLPSSPEITSAKRDGNRVTVAGKELVDTSACGGEALRVKLTKEGAAAGDEPLVVRLTPSGATAGTFTLPPAAREGTWNVQLLLGNEEQGEAVKIEQAGAE